MGSAHSPPIFFDEVFDDPSRVRALVEREAPYAPVQRYLRNQAEFNASSGHAAMVIAPNFRGHWAYDGDEVEGIDFFLHHEGFVAAARRLFGAQCVRPFAVFSNLTWQLPFAQGEGHIDVPEFRGISRIDYPVWLLNMMGHSGLFEAERIRIATAVAWFYRGSDGGFDYWPEGPQAAPRVHEGDIFNTALVGDNDRMFHRVRPTGDPARGLPKGMSLDSELRRVGPEEWGIFEGDRAIARFPYSELRISVSWKAHVFADEAEEARTRSGEADLEIGEVFERFRADLARCGEKLPHSDSPLDDPAIVAALARRHVGGPSRFDRAGAPRE